MLESCRASGVIPAAPRAIYDAYLSSEGHTAMTGAVAAVDGRVGGKFSAWDGYITGTTLALEPGRRIEQAWRTTEFPDGHPDSKLEVLLEAVEGGTMVTFNHTEIPAGQAESYRQGWEDFYLKPIADYFGSLS